MRLEATADLSEGDFLDAVLAQLRSGQRPLYARLTAADLEAIEEEWIGAHFSRYPFLY